MILITSLNKPYTIEQRVCFIEENQNKHSYTIIETEFAIEAWEYTEEEQAKQRETAFLQDFFNVDGYGYYRKSPKGYQSAVESMNVLFNIANVSDGIQEGLIIFYQEPDFTKPEQCTEEWLIEHQIIQPAMTKEAFMQLYVAFMTAWNTQEHTKEEDETTTDNNL